MRKVEYRERKFVDGKWVITEPSEGMFHQWGSEYEEFENGPGNYTVGIVETPDGKIITVIPEDMRFINDDYYLRQNS